MRAAILALGLALSACTANIDEGFYSCDDDICPPGWHCHSSGLCYSTPEPERRTFASPCTTDGQCMEGLLCDLGPRGDWPMGYCTPECTMADPFVCPFPLCHPWGKCVIPCTIEYTCPGGGATCIGVIAGQDPERGQFTAGACYPNPSDAAPTVNTPCDPATLMCPPGSICVSDSTPWEELTMPMTMCARPCIEGGPVECAAGEVCFYGGDQFSFTAMCSTPCSAPGIGPECTGFADTCTDLYGDMSTLVCLPAGWLPGGFVVMPG